jgi:hypothetical protein
MLRRAIVCISALSALLLAAPAFAAPFPGASGMARLDDTHYLCVQDRKADKSGAAVGVLSVHPAADSGPGGRLLDYAPLELRDWHGAKANDLEAVCALPGGGLDFLACESGYYHGAYGRLFVLHAEQGRHGWKVKQEQTLQLPQFADQIEGLACAGGDAGRVLLILSERGGKDGGSPGQLHWGWLDELRAAQRGPGRPAEGWSFQSVEIPNPFDASYPGARAVSDLYLDPEGTLWTASAYDPDTDYGPFTSCVWPVASVDPQAEEAVTRMLDWDRTWLLEGLKIEALSAPCTEGAYFSIATDDEGYGGIWRPLGEPTDILRDEDN